VRIFDRTRTARIRRGGGGVRPDYVGSGSATSTTFVMEEGVSFVSDVRERFARALRTADARAADPRRAFFDLPAGVCSRVRRDYGVVGEGEAAFPACWRRSSAAATRSRSRCRRAGRRRHARRAPVMLDLLPSRDRQPNRLRARTASARLPIQT